MDTVFGLVITEVVNSLQHEAFTLIIGWTVTGVFVIRFYDCGLEDFSVGAPFSRFGAPGRRGFSKRRLSSQKPICIAFDLCLERLFHISP